MKPSVLPEVVHFPARTWAVQQSRTYWLVRQYFSDLAIQIASEGLGSGRKAEKPLVCWMKAQQS